MLGCGRILCDVPWTHDSDVHSHPRFHLFSKPWSDLQPSTIRIAVQGRGWSCSHLWEQQSMEQRSDFQECIHLQLSSLDLHRTPVPGRSTCNLCRNTDQTMQVPVALAHVLRSQIVAGCSFYANSCPRNPGAVYAEAPLTLIDSELDQNNADQVFFGTARLAELSATNTRLHFSREQGAPPVATL